MKKTFNVPVSTADWIHASTSANALSLVFECKERLSKGMQEQSYDNTVLNSLVQVLGDLVLLLFEISEALLGGDERAELGTEVGIEALTEVRVRELCELRNALQARCGRRKA